MEGFLACVAMGKGGTQNAPSKSPKLKMIYQLNFPHRSMYPLPPFFVCFSVWFMSRDESIT